MFEFLPKMAKRKIPSISLIVRDRAISLKFSAHRVSKEGTLQFSKNFPLPKNGGHFELSKEGTLQFSKNFPLPKNGGHFEFSDFCQKWQNTNLLLSP